MPGSDSFRSKFGLMVIWDRLDAIRDQASYLLAGSKAGVAFQIMQANVHLDVLVQEDEREQRRIEAQNDPAALPRH